MLCTQLLDTELWTCDAVGGSHSQPSWDVPEESERHSLFSQGHQWLIQFHQAHRNELEEASPVS